MRRAKRGDDELCLKAEKAVSREVGGWYQRELTVGSNPELYLKKGQRYEEDDKEVDEEDDKEVDEEDDEEEDE